MIILRWQQARFRSPACRARCHPSVGPRAAIPKSPSAIPPFFALVTSTDPVFRHPKKGQKCSQLVSWGYTRKKRAQNTLCFINENSPKLRKSGISSQPARRPTPQSVFQSTPPVKTCQRQTPQKGHAGGLPRSEEAHPGCQPNPQKHTKKGPKNAGGAQINCYALRLQRQWIKGLPALTAH